MPSRAERRPARDDFPPRRIRATVPAHSKPECRGDALLGFDELIERKLRKIFDSTTLVTTSVSIAKMSDEPSRSPPDPALDEQHPPTLTPSKLSAGWNGGERPEPHQDR